MMPSHQSLQDFVVWAKMRERETHSILQSGQSSNSRVLRPRLKKSECVCVCVQNSDEIKVTMSRTTAASGLGGWGTRHNSPLINTEYRHSAAAHTYL